MNHSVLLCPPQIVLILNHTIRLIFFLFFFHSDRYVVTDLTRVTEFPCEVTNEHVSVSMYDATPALHPGSNTWHETT